ncbi:hypothetical protein ABK040_005007 [Willaertia magna]
MYNTTNRRNYYNDGQQLSYNNTTSYKEDYSNYHHHRLDNKSKRSYDKDYSSHSNRKNSSYEDYEMRDEDYRTTTTTHYSTTTTTTKSSSNSNNNNNSKVISSLSSTNQQNKPYGLQVLESKIQNYNNKLPTVTVGDFLDIFKKYSDSFTLCSYIVENYHTKIVHIFPNLKNVSDGDILENLYINILNNIDNCKIAVTMRNIELNERKRRKEEEEIEQSLLKAQKNTKKIIKLDLNAAVSDDDDDED